MARDKTASPYLEALKALEDALDISTNAAGQTLQTAAELQEAKADLAAAKAQIETFDYDGKVAKLTKELDDLKKSIKDKTMTMENCDAHRTAEASLLMDKLTSAERSKNHFQATAEERIGELIEDKQKLEKENDELKQENKTLKKNDGDLIAIKGRTSESEKKLDDVKSNSGDVSKSAERSGCAKEEDKYFRNETKKLRNQLSSVRAALRTFYDALNWDITKLGLTVDKSKIFKNSFNDDSWIQENIDAWLRVVAQEAGRLQTAIASKEAEIEGLKKAAGISDNIFMKNDTSGAQSQLIQHLHHANAEIVRLNAKITRKETEHAAQAKELHDQIKADAASHADETSAFGRNITSLRDKIAILERQVHGDAGALIRIRDEEVRGLKEEIAIHKVKIKHLEAIRDDLTAGDDAQLLNPRVGHRKKGVEAKYSTVEKQIFNLAGQGKPT